MSLPVITNLKSVNIWQSYKQERDCLVHFVRLANTLLEDWESARNNHVLDCNFAKYSPISKNFFHSFTHRLSSKPFLIWLLATPPHLECVARLPCNLSLIACFADINVYFVSRGSVATYAMCGGIFDIHLTANLPRNLPVKKFLKQLRTDRIMVMSLWPRFWPTL